MSVAVRDETQASAAVAFKHMCDGTSRHLVDEPHMSSPPSAPTPDSAANSGGDSSVQQSSSSFLPSLLAVYKASASLRLSDQRDIIEGMCSVVSVLDQPRLTNYLQPMLHPIIGALQAAMAQHAPVNHSAGGGGASGADKAPAALYDGLDRLAALFSHLEPHRNDQPDDVRAAIMQCTQQCWPALEAITAHYGGDERCMEKVCRCWRYAMKKTGNAQHNHFTPAVPLMLRAITAQYERHHTSSAQHERATAHSAVGVHTSGAQCLPWPLTRLVVLLCCVASCWILLNSPFLYVLATAIDQCSSQADMHVSPRDSDRGSLITLPRSRQCFSCGASALFLSLVLCFSLCYIPRTAPWRPQHCRCCPLRRWWYRAGLPAARPLSARLPLRRLRPT